MNTRFFLIALGVGGIAAALTAQAQTIDLRLSVKIIVHPTTGARPRGSRRNCSPTPSRPPTHGWRVIGAATATASPRWRRSAGPAQGGTNGPSKWFGRDPRNTADGTWQSFQADVQGSGLYLLRTDALNYYVTSPTNWNTGGAAPFPWEAPAWIAAWGIVNDGPFWVVHECGHFYGLVHTHGGCGCPSTSGCTFLNGYWVGDDGLTDTLKEAAGDFCFTNINQLTLANFNSGSPTAPPRTDPGHQHLFQRHVLPRPPTRTRS
jgi:hypothetical protein